jgi:hypothetical protein
MTQIELSITNITLALAPNSNLVPRSLFRSLHKSQETAAKTIHKILVDDLIFANLQFRSIENFNSI